MKKGILEDMCSNTTEYLVTMEQGRIESPTLTDPFGLT